MRTQAGRVGIPARTTKWEAEHLPVHLLGLGKMVSATTQPARAVLVLVGLAAQAAVAVVLVLLPLVLVVEDQIPRWEIQVYLLL